MQHTGHDQSANDHSLSRSRFPSRSLKDNSINNSDLALKKAFVRTLATSLEFRELVTDIHRHKEVCATLAGVNANPESHRMSPPPENRTGEIGDPLTETGLEMLAIENGNQNAYQLNQRRERQRGKRDHGHESSSSNPSPNNNDFSPKQVNRKKKKLRKKAAEGPEKAQSSASNSESSMDDIEFSSDSDDQQPNKKKIIIIFLPNRSSSKPCNPIRDTKAAPLLKTMILSRRETNQGRLKLSGRTSRPNKGFWRPIAPG